MQNDWVFWLIEKVKYPWVSRLDRSMYRSHSTLDPTNLAFECLIAAVGGYWVGRALGRNRVYYSIAATSGFVAYYLVKEWSLSSDLRAFDDLDFKISNKISFFSRVEPQSISSSENTVQKKIVPRFKNIRKMPELQTKIYTSKDFINQLSPSYFS